MATQTIDDSNPPTPQAAPTDRPPLMWRLTILAGVVSGVIWALILAFGGAQVQLLAGLAPVAGGIYLGRKVKTRGLAHGGLMALAAVIAALAILLPLILVFQLRLPLNPPEVPSDPVSDLAQVGMFMLLSLIPFPIYGVMIATRNQKRFEESRKLVDQRGGTLRNSGRVVNLDDLQALSLDKFGFWVSKLFVSNGFTMIDYSFGKDMVDLKLKREDPAEDWLVRCTVAESVKPGMVQQLGQELRESEFHKAVLVTSTTVQESASKWVKGRRNLAVIDGATLLEMKD